MADKRKFPRVKRRLARDIGDVAALVFYRRCAARTLRLARDPRWQTVVALTPDRASRGLRGLAPRNLRIVPQGRGDLGTRMARVFQTLGPGRIAIVGADIPDMNARHIARAFRALGGVDAVFGPAVDGGFWLVGLRRAALAPRIFANVRWSSRHALADVRKNLAVGARVALIETLEDVDDGESYRRFLAAR